MSKDFNDISDKVKENWNNYVGEFKKCLNDLKNRETFYKQIPNLLTVFRVVGMIPFNILFLTGNMYAAIILLGVILLTDFFDGKIARKYGIATKFGADLDAICDKIMSFGLITPLIIESPLLIINLFLEISIASINFYRRIKGIDTKTLFSGKIKTWLLSITLGLGYLTKFITDVQSLFVLFSLVTIPAQVKTTCDYVKYSTLENKEKNEEFSNDEINTIITKEEQIEKMIREKEFLLSLNEKDNKNVKVKKRKK